MNLPVRLHDAIHEAVVAGEISRQSANMLIHTINSDDREFRMELPEIESEREVRIRGTLVLEFETMATIPMEPCSDEDLDQRIVPTFESIVDSGVAEMEGEGSSFSISDVRVQTSRIVD